jgi:hypothetical protein
MSWITSASNGVILQVKLVPRSSANRVEGVLGDALKIKLQAPPVDGKANKALIQFLSKTIGVPAARIALVSGATARTKRIAVSDITEAELRGRLKLGN